jgi:hypothetical protein
MICTENRNETQWAKTPNDQGIARHVESIKPKDQRRAKYNHSPSKNMCKQVSDTLKFANCRKKKKGPQKEEQPPLAKTGQIIATQTWKPKIAKELLFETVYAQRPNSFIQAPAWEVV